MVKRKNNGTVTVRISLSDETKI